MSLKVYQLDEGYYATSQYDPKTGKLEIYTHEYKIPLVEDNRRLQNDPSNGFGKSREGVFGRLIGRPTDSQYRQWQLEFERMGGKKQNRWTDDWRKFLRKKLQENQEARTVKKLRSVNPNEKHVIVK